MPLFSEHISNMYYGGSPLYTSSSYGYSSSGLPLGNSYSASYLNPGGNYSSHSSLGSYSRTPLTSRWISGIGRNYSPILSTISERSTASPVRINSPRRIPITKRSYGSSGYISRPININTADIDVSKDKYRKKTEAPVPSPPQRKESPRNETEKDNSPFMPRVDGKPETGIDSSPGVARSTIKRGRTVVRLHTIRRKERDSPRKPVQVTPNEDSADNKAVENVTQNCQSEPQESSRWRERLSEDLVYKDKKAKKTLGTKLAEKFMVKNTDKEKTPEKEPVVNILKDTESSQSLPVTPIPSTSKSPDRRCSMEILAEQAKLFDSLIRKENLSTAPLDISKIGVEDESQNNVNSFGPIERRKSNNKINPLKTTKSDHSLHNSLKSSHGQDVGKNTSKRRSLKKSSSGGSICRLDSITEFPKETLNKNLSAIDESKPESVTVKPKSKLKTKITASVDVSPPKSPLKFRIEDVVVEEKPRVIKKGITFSSQVDETPTQDSTTLEKDVPSQHNETQIIKRKVKKIQPDLPSPEPEDGNFWNKIGKRETVYLIKRKEILQEAKEKHKRAFFLQPEAESVKENELEENKETMQVNDEVNNKVCNTIKPEDSTSSESNKRKTTADCIAETKPKETIINKAIEYKNVPNPQKIDNSLSLETKELSVNTNILKLQKVKQSPENLQFLENKLLGEFAQKGEADLNKQISGQSMKERNKETIGAPLKIQINTNTEIVDLTRKDDTLKSNETKELNQKDNIINKETNQNTQKEVIEKNILLKVSPQKDDVLVTTELKELPQKECEVQPVPSILEESIISNDSHTTEQTKMGVQILNQGSKGEQTKPNVEENNNDIKIIDTVSKSENIIVPLKNTEMQGSDFSFQNMSVCSEKVHDQKEKIVFKENQETSEVLEKEPEVKSNSNKIKSSKKVSSKKSALNKYCEIKVDQENLSESSVSNERNKALTLKESRVQNEKKGSSKQSKENCPQEKSEPIKVIETNKESEFNLKDPENQSVPINKNDQNSSELHVELPANHLEGASNSNDVITSNCNDTPETKVVIEIENIPINEIEAKAVCTVKEEQHLRNSNNVEPYVKKEEQEVKRPTIKAMPNLPELPTPKKPVKQAAALRPLIATPRPLQKRAPQIIHSSESSDSSSEEETSDEEDDECDGSEDSEEFYECDANTDGRTSTGSNDSGFDSSAPTSPAGFQQIRKGGDVPGTSSSNAPVNNNSTEILEQELEQSTAYGIFRKTGRFTPPARSIPRFRKYTIEDFNFIKVLGKGSFGKVLLAELRDTEYYYAVKCLKKDVVLEDDDVECTLIERKVLALGTNHPYLCHLFATFQTDSHLFFVMEYLNGGDLMFHIQQSGRFPEARARFYAAEIVSGLKFLHKRGIIYRDLKLDNILLDFDGHVRIADFGMCKLQIYLDKTADTFCGTPDYMAPEIIKGLKYNQTVDWWSFGVLLYEMLIGQSPFSGCDEDELFWSICNEMPSYPRFLSQEALTILTRLLDKDARSRLGGTECMHGDIREQAFFHSIHWDRLERRDLEAPFRPRVRHPLDTQYFDRAFTGERPRLTAVEPQVLRSMDQEPFRGFSYTNPNATDR